jgi:hypothetical protein
MPKFQRGRLTREASPASQRAEPAAAAPMRAGAFRHPSPGAVVQRAMRAPGSLRAAELLSIQRTLGNRAAGAMLGRAPVGAKLIVNAPNDRYEREADRVARHVVEVINMSPSRPAGQVLRRQGKELGAQLKSAESLTPGREDRVRTKPAVQGQSGGRGTAVPNGLEAAIQRARYAGRPIDQNLRRPMEEAFGADLSAVRIHADARSDELNQAVGARAFTSGHDVFFRRGAYNPGSTVGQEVLAHELTHVVQQSGSKLRRVSDARADAGHDNRPAVHRRGTDTSFPEITTTNSRTLRRTIQRLIGFEIETRIPVWFDKGGGTLEKPDYDSINANVGLSDGSKLTVDKEGTKSIIEFASGPVDDTQRPEQFESIAMSWVGVLSRLHAKAAKTPPLANFHAMYSSAPTETRFGFTDPDAKAQSIDKVAIQVTHGLRLDLVPEYLSNIEYNDKSATRYQRKEEALHETQGPANRVMDKLLLKFPPSGNLQQYNVQYDYLLQKLRGFISLIVHYLILGGKKITAYLKNQLSLFYKSELSDVRNNIAREGTYAAYVLSDPDRRKWLRETLLKQTKRSKDELLFTMTKAEARETEAETEVKAGDWVEAVLAGTGDPFFKAAKNPWGKAIEPGAVLGKHAVVVEHRDLLSEMPPESTLNLSALSSRPGSVVDYLCRVFNQNAKAQKLWQ